MIFKTFHFRKKPLLESLFFCLLISCGPKTFDKKKDLWAYIQNTDNGYIQTQNIRNLTYTLMYKPADLIVSQFLDSVSESKVNNLRTKYEKYMYFNLSIAKDGRALLSDSRDRKQFGRMVQQLSFGMDSKICLHTSAKDTIPMIDYTAPRMYGMAPATQILLVYAKIEETYDSDYLFLNIEDFGLMSGDVTFKIPTKPIKQQPQLNF